MRKILLLSLLLIPLSLIAQESRVPDNDDIFAKTIDVNSPFYYPALMLRYTSGDTTLTQEDYHYLYYGFAFTDNYHPLKSIPAEDQILMIFDRVGEEPTYDDMVELIRQGTEVLKTDPFSPKNLNFLTYAYGAIGDTINESLNYNRMTKIVGVIENSGTGLVEKSPMHVLKFSHASDVLTSRGLIIANRRVVSRSTEYVSLVYKEGQNKGYYFDFSRVFWNAPDEAPQKERKWKINDWTPGTSIF